MPQIDWTPEFKRASTPEFDRLKLKVGERARIVCLEKPTFTWIHTLKAPKLTDGRATKVIKKRKDGTEYADWDMDFIGRPQCLGDHTTIAEDGSDPKNCPVCARAKESEEVAAPERRFAMNIIKYNTKADGNVVSPFGCSSVVWAFTENNFNKLIDVAQEHNGLVGKDLILGPCQPPENFQKFDIAAGAKNIWETDDNVKRIVVETHKNNRVEDLEAACGRKVQERFLKDDLDKIASRWRIAHGKADAPVISEKQDVATLKGELDNLLAPAPAEQPNPRGVVDARQANLDTQVGLEQPSATDSDTGKPTGGSDPDDFSKLLQGLNI